MKIIIVGGVAGGASAAARARRLSESAEILLIERGNYVSFANCGLPYYVGNEIQQREKLIVTQPQRLRDRFRIDVRTRSNVIQIKPNEKRVVVKDLASGNEYEESYDKLILSPVPPRSYPPLREMMRPVFSRFELWRMSTRFGRSSTVVFLPPWL